MAAIIFEGVREIVRDVLHLDAAPDADATFESLGADWAHGFEIILEIEERIGPILNSRFADLIAVGGWTVRHLTETVEGAVRV